MRWEYFGSGLALLGIGITMLLALPPPGWPNMPRWALRAGLLAGLALIIYGLAFTVMGIWPETLRPRILPILAICTGLFLIIVGSVWFAKIEIKNKESPTKISFQIPDVVLSFSHPAFPVIVLTNQSDVLATNIKWSVYLWNMDDPKPLRSNPHAADHPGMHDPLPIPTSVFEFLKPRQSSNRIDLFGNVSDYVKKGQQLIGTASVDCPDCVGHTYIVSIVWGEGGWFAEIVEANGERLQGRTLIPESPYKEAVVVYQQKMLALAPEASRIPIRE